MAGEEAKGAAVDGKAFDAEDFQAVTNEQGLEGGYGEIEDVFVVNRVELGMFDEIDGVGEFEDDSAFGLQKRLQAGDEVVGVWGVGEDVVAEDEVSFFAGGGEFFGKVVAEEFDDGFDAFFAGDFGDVGGGFNAEARNVGFSKVLKDLPVVAGDFDDLALAIQ